MRPWFIGVAIVLLAGCAATGGSGGDYHSDAPASPLGSPFASGPTAHGRTWPLILDRTDMSIGTTVVFSRVPTVGELHDLELVQGMQHLLIALPSWPRGAESIEALQQLAPETDAIIVLPGYPPTRESAEAWNLLGARVRIVCYVTEAPPSAAVVGDLNTMRGLERVICETDDPRRTGFERLQRPLSFRKVVE